MATTTTNFGFDVPTSSDLVKNGATQIALLGQDIDTFLAGSPTYTAGKNKIINGNMLVDQRNSATTPATINSAAVTYAVDRWAGFGQATDGVFTLGQDASAPAGFTKSLKATITTADASLGATQAYQVRTSLEGQSVADFDYGLATAKTVTLSFWVRSSLTGNFGGAIRNAAANRSYPFLYAISAANTWEKKSVVIAGDTTGTWDKTTDNGWGLSFSMGGGADRIGTAGAWNANNNSGATGQVQVISTLNATWYVTGVQVEIGSQSTPFQTASGTIGGELSLCQRYYYRAGGESLYQFFGWGVATNTTTASISILPSVKMRSVPSALDYGTLAVTHISGLATVSAAVFDITSSLLTQLNITTTGLTAGQFIRLLANGSTSGFVALSAEL